MSDVVLRVRGQEFSGWEELDAELSLESACGGYSLTVSDVKDWDIREGDECSLSLKGETIISGWIDSVEATQDENNHTITITGRDKAADMVDCAAVVPGGEVHGQNLLQIAQMVAKPFGITVTTDSDTTGDNFLKTSLQPGDSAWQFVENLGRQRGVLMVSDGVGNVLLTTPGKTRSKSSLVMGENVKSATVKLDNSNRFSQYIVKGQTIPTDGVDDDVAVKVTASVKDDGVLRYRPKLVICEGVADKATALRRAKWEAAVAVGRAVEVSVQVQGWEELPGEGVWRPNRIAPVSIPNLGVSEDLLIVSVKFKLGPSGTTTDIKLTRADAYQLEPYDKRQKKSKDSGSIPNIPFGPAGVPSGGKT